MWKDTTSYSRGKPRIPSCWTINIGDLRIAVTKGHIYHPGKWVMHCEPWFNSREIADDTLPEDQAKHVALDAVRSKVRAASDAFAKLKE